jgi:spore coat protein B
MRKDLLESLVGKVIKVDRGGPNSRVGKLLSVSDNFFTLLTEDDGVVFFATHHIKSITENTRHNLKFNMDVPKDLKYISSNHFDDLLAKLKFHWIKINRGGPEKIEGVLHEANKDFVTVVSNEEIIRLSTFHIKNLSYDLMVGKGKKNDKKDDGKDKDKDDGKDDKNDKNDKNDKDHGKDDKND